MIYGVLIKIALLKAAFKLMKFLVKVKKILIDQACNFLKNCMALFVVPVLLIIAFSGCCACAETYNSYLVFYGSEIDIKKISCFEAVVIDPKAKIDIAKLHKKKVTVFAYLSLGEINKAVPEYEKFINSGIIVMENPSWPGSFYVDASSGLWSDYILKEALPALTSKDYDGVFLDTLDSPAALANEFPGRYKNGTAAVYEIIKKIRESNPNLIIIANNFEDHADKIGVYVNAFNVESLVGTYNFKTKKYEYCDKKLSAERVKKLQKLKKDYNTQIFVVDYVSNSNYKVVRNIYKKIKSFGFIPCVSEIGLNKINRYFLRFVKRDKKH